MLVAFQEVRVSASSRSHTDTPPTVEELRERYLAMYIAAEKEVTELLNVRDALLADLQRLEGALRQIVDVPWSTDESPYAQAHDIALAALLEEKPQLRRYVLESAAICLGLTAVWLAAVLWWPQ